MKVYLCLVFVGLVLVNTNANSAKIVRKNKKSNDEPLSSNSVNHFGEIKKTGNSETLTQPLVEANILIDRIRQLLQTSNIDGSLNKHGGGHLLVGLIDGLLSLIRALLPNLGIGGPDSLVMSISSFLSVVESVRDGLTNIRVNPKVNGLNSLLKSTGFALQDSTHGSQTEISSLSHQKQHY